MTRIRSLLLFFAMIATAACACAPAFAKLDVFPMDKVRAGMKGQGRTVFRGVEPEPFDVEVLGVLAGGGPGGGDMVLVRVSGAQMQKVGGVAMGMSGSPVYINGKLLGALSSTFSESDHSLAGVTPIGDMMLGYDYLDKPGKVRIDPPVTVDGVQYSLLDYTGTETGPQALHPRFALAPVAIRGLSERSYKFLKPFFEKSGMDMLPYDAMPAAMETGARNKGGIQELGRGKDLKPGASIAVQLVRGDIDISAVGTLTAIDGNKVLAFGHPFFRKGPVNYLLADAPVLAIMNSTAMSFKITSTGLLRGSIQQDRGSAILGYLDKYPSLVPLDVTVEDMDIGRSRDYHVKIVRDEDLLPNLIVSVLVNAIDNTIDRFGPGTATMDFTLKADGVDTAITRTNMFYSGYDVSAASLQELMMALGLLKENYLQQAGVSGLKATIRLKAAHDTAAIVQADLFDPDTRKIIGKSEDSKTKDKAGKAQDNGGKNKDLDKDSKNKKDKQLDSEDNDKDLDLDAEDEDLESEDENIGDDPDDEEYDEDQGDEQYDEDEGDEQYDEDEGEFDDDEDDDSDQGAADLRAGRASARQSRAGRRRRPELTKVYPGQKLGVKITLRPYKKDEMQEEIFIKIPKDIPHGTAVVRVFSGIKYMNSGFGAEGTFFDFMMEDFLRPEHGIRDSRDRKKKETLDDILKKFLERDHNNEIVATVTSMSAAPRVSRDEDEEDDYDEEDEESYLDEYDIESPPPDRAKKATDWVLFGSSAIRVRVTDSQDGDSFKTRGIEKSKIKTLEQKGNGN